MRKVIAAINMTLDGVFDHTAGLPDQEIHQHYTELLKQGGVILYGRKTYELMEFWRTFLENPSQEQSMNEFANAIDRIPKIVFSHTLKNVDWSSATLADRDLKETISDLKDQPGKDIFVGSRSLILELIELNLVDELQLCIYPVIAAGGAPLFDGIAHRTMLKLSDTKTFSGGGIILYYEPERENPQSDKIA